MVLALLDQPVLEVLQVRQHVHALDLVRRVRVRVVLLVRLAPDQRVELHIAQVVELRRIDHLHVFEGQRNFFLLSQPLPLLFETGDFPVFELPLQVFLLHPFLRLLDLPRLGVLIVEHLAHIELVSVEVVLEIVLAVSGDHLLVDGLGELGDGILLSLHVALQLLVAPAKPEDLFVFDEAQGVLQVAEPMAQVVGLLRQ